MGEHRGDTLFAFLLGGLVGAGLAILFAPQSGAETRRRIRDGVEGAGGWASDKASDVKYRVEDGVERARHFVDDKREDIAAAFEAGKEAYHKGRERLKGETG